MYVIRNELGSECLNCHFFSGCHRCFSSHKPQHDGSWSRTTTNDIKSGTFTKTINSGTVYVDKQICICVFASYTYCTYLAHISLRTQMNLWNVFLMPRNKYIYNIPEDFRL